MTLKLANSANVGLIESYLFDTLYATNAYQVSDNPDMTLDYGFKGFIFDANKANNNTRTYAVKMYGRRLTLSNCIIANSKGVGLWTALKGNHSGGYDYTKTKVPGNMGEIAVIDCEEEGFIFEGPSDQQVGHVITNVIGDQSNNGTTPQTSTHFSGQEVSGLRVEASMNLSSGNFNGTRFGRNLYASSGRLTFGNIITAGGWGNVWFGSGCEGTVDSLLTQANSIGWLSTPKPSILNESDDLNLTSVIVARISGQDQPSVPLIRDTAGANWGLIKSRQALTEGGVLFEATTSNVNIGLIKAKGVGVVLQTISSAVVNVSCEFNNCNLVWDNDRGNVRGSWDFSGALTVGQVFATGLESSPNADEESLSNARIEFSLDGVWLSNSFRGVATWDSTITAGQSVVFTHGMWRAPKVEEIMLSARVSGWSSEPEGLCLTVNGFNATSVTARVKLGTAAVGSSASQIICKI